MKWQFILLALVAATAQAAESMDAVTLRKHAEYSSAPVVDARGAAESSQLPVSGSLAFDRELRITEKRVVVIADDDKEALAAAQTLERVNAGLSAVALKGGYDALRMARPEAKLRTREESTPDFTIPSDTCQTGAPLQSYENGK